MRFLAIAVLMLQVCAVAENAETIQYAYTDESVLLICQQTKGAEGLRWLSDSLILTNGQNINKQNPSHTRLSIDNKSDGRHYNLRIANVTAHDFGVYQCEMQTSKGISRKKVTLKYQDLQKLSTTNPTTREIEDKMPETTILAEVSSTRSIETTLVDTEKSVPTNDVNYSYGIFTAGFIVVLLVSIGCNSCIGKYRHKAIRTKVDQQKIDIQNPKSSDDNVQEFVSGEQISNASSKYETINENDVALSFMSNQGHRIDITHTYRKSATQLDNSYLEVIGDESNSASNTAVNVISPDTSSNSNIKSSEVYRYEDNNMTSYLSMDKTNVDKLETPTASNNPKDVKMCSVNTFVKKEDHSVKKTEYTNSYFTLDKSDMDNCYSDCTSGKPGIDSMVQNETHSCITEKRHSCP